MSSSIPAPESTQPDVHDIDTRHGRHGDDPVPTHGAEAFVMHEQHAEIGPGRHRIRYEAAIHVGVAPGFEHQDPANLIEFGLREFALGQHRCSRYRRHAAGNDPERLAPSVSVNHRPAPPIRPSAHPPIPPPAIAA